jgi:hypothetical protein
VQIRIFLEAYCELLLLSLRRDRSARAMAILSQSQVPTSAARFGPLEEERIVMAVDRSLRSALRIFPLPVHCIERAMVLQVLLSRRGIWAAMRIGVLKDGKALLAHAWIECNGYSLTTSRPHAGTYKLLVARPEEF